MKKIIFLFGMTLLPLFTLAQLREPSIKTSFGIMVVPHSGYVFGENKPSTSTTMFVALNAFTKKFHYHVMYDATSNAPSTLDGINLSNGWDAYTMIEKSISNKTGYVGFGIEKAKIFIPSVPIIPFFEIGSGYNGSNFDKCIVTLGVVLHPQYKLFEKK